ncbi:MAG: excinuclease ABC subunit UvrC [Chloroflexi bacterium]|nr:excinuclease ABC subunit UvrC [Chloroflexota bacterium]
MSYSPPEAIQQVLDNLPSSPGVYQMLDGHGEIIYIGKAKNLRSRVRSYFQPSNLDTKVLKIRQQVADIRILVMESETAALTAEAQLIRAHKPRYNVIWKDDKRYPYIVVRTRDPFPKVEMTRRVNRNDGNRYFGPYSSGWAIRQLLDTLRKAFPFLTCDRVITGQDQRACLYYDIKLCGAPCIGAQSQDEYRQSINDLMRVLEGKTDVVLRELNQDMEASADALDFERAALLRDQIQAISQATARQYRITDIGADRDVLSLVCNGQMAMVQLLVIRNGNLISSDSFPLINIQDEAETYILASFITQYYESAFDIPPEIILPAEVPDADVLATWLRERRESRKVKLTVPQRGEKRKLIQQATETATEQLTLFQARWEKDTVRQEKALAEIQEALHLSNPPNRIECYDISTLHGTSTVASRVVFVQGTPYKSEYRRFNIRTIEHDGADDYQAMREALTRRFQRYVDAINDTEPPVPGKPDRNETWRLLPDLMLIDGGKGQLNVAMEVLEAFELTEHVPVAGLAKRFEEVYLPRVALPVFLPRKSEGSQLLQRIRDEAHRFAITSHRKQRTKKGMASQLEAVSGIGPNKRKALLAAFDNDIGAIRRASIKQLTAVPGITENLARKIKQELV